MPRKLAVFCGGGFGGIARIELATSCTLSKNHTTRPNAHRTTQLKRKEVYIFKNEDINLIGYQVTNYIP